MPVRRRRTSGASYSATPKEQQPPEDPTDPDLPPDAFITPQTSLTYWSSTPSTLSGMLGGYPQVSHIDIAGSRTFLSKLRRLPSSNSNSDSKSTLPLPPAKLRCVADCGAGIGRITTNLLISVAERIDIVEPVSKFTEQLRLENPDLFTGVAPVVRNVYNTPLESWQPPLETQYDLIWNQWCLGHLPDISLIHYLSSLIRHLAEGGFIVVKENLSTDAFGEDIYDPEDSSVTRSQVKFERVFEEAGLGVVRSEVQRGGFGRGLGLLPVRMWGLQPLRGTREEDLEG